MHRVSVDRVIACMLLPVVLPILAVLYVVVLVFQGRPFLYSSQRMRDADTAFSLYKIRTMHTHPLDVEGALGGHQKRRVTPVGRWLRRYRLDELPQIFNVLKGDMRFIGPRPPLPKHVAACPRRYRRLLSNSRPGITGLATVMVHAREERLLTPCGSAEETERVYLRRCLPVKLRLDAIYQRNRSLRLDLVVLWLTFVRLTSRDRRAPSVKPLRSLAPVMRNA